VRLRNSDTANTATVAGAAASLLVPPGVELSGRGDDWTALSARTLTSPSDGPWSTIARTPDVDMVLALMTDGRPIDDRVGDHGDLTLFKPSTL
jgi:hypothetical protein